MEKNIKYTARELSDYYANSRIRWEQFYESEKKIIEDLGIASTDSVLDIGCGCGGLGLALRDKFGVTNYTGVEINELAAHKAEAMNPSAVVLCGDFLELSESVISGKVFDLVFSLSCFDWNLQFDDMLLSAWNHVKEGGGLVATFRIVVTEGCSDMKKSYQYINYDGNLSGEKAAYVVLNAQELFGKLLALSPSSITASGYFGAPSRTAITPYTGICFTAMSITKRQANDNVKPRLDLQLPNEILLHLES
jgi:SAM-dependent methyltransferase